MAIQTGGATSNGSFASLSIIKLGATTINNICIGNTKVIKVYIGNTLVFGN